ncbi:UPF0755 protein [Anaerotaenia torta]|uniref:hypothetical protein n=1 Tax=Anaerotaenia torta TaxID=433293 RepID=UPI003D22D96E
MATKSTAVKLTLKVTSFIVRLLLNIIFYILVVVLIVNVSKTAFAFTYQIYGPERVDEAPGRDIIFQIAKGESKMDIAAKLEHNHAIKNKYSFYLKTKFQEYVIIPGTYVINSSMTYDEILAVITDYSKAIIKDSEDAEEDTGDAADDTEK